MDGASMISKRRKHEHDPRSRTALQPESRRHSSSARVDGRVREPGNRFHRADRIDDLYGADPPIRHTRRLSGRFMRLR
jgi:hypothetical protein